MRRRAWAGTVLVACLIALAGLLRDHELVVGLLLAAAVVSGVVIAWDRRLTRERVRQRPTDRSCAARELGHVQHELDTLLGIVQSDAPGYSVPVRRKELADIGCTVARLLTARPDLWSVYDSPLPEPQPDGQLMDHDEHIFEAQLQHRRDMLAEVIGRLELPPTRLVQ